MQTRIYVVIETDGTKRMVEATSQNQAISHCVQGRYKATVASAKDVAQLTAEGITVEKAEKQRKSKTESNGNDANDNQGEQQ